MRYFERCVRAGKQLQMLGALVLLAWVSSGSLAQAQEIAITFDDLPAHSVLPPGETRVQVAKAVITALRQAGVPPTYGFVNAIRIQQQPGDAAVLDLWRESGNLLGTTHGLT